MSYLLLTNPETGKRSLVEYPPAAIPYAWDAAWDMGLEVKVVSGCQARRLVGEGEVVNYTGLHRWPDGTGHRTKPPTLTRI